MERKSKTEIKDYKCPWCQNEFKQGVRKVRGTNGGKRMSISDQVKCPICLNFIKTW